MPALLIIGWFVVAAVAGPYFGKVDEVSSNSQTSYLPTSADATKVQDRLSEFTGSSAVPAVVVFTADHGKLTKDQIHRLHSVAKPLSTVHGTTRTSPVMISKDGRAAQAFTSVKASAEPQTVVTQVRDQLRSGLSSGVTVHVTGPAGFNADLSDAFGGIDGLLLGVALGAVLIILVIVYRSVILPFAVLITSMFALCAAFLTVWWLAKADILTLTGQTQGILFILVIGAATDYSLLYTARYREELRHRPDKIAAAWSALRAARGPIIASAGTVIAGLLCLLLSDLNSNRSLGPVAAIGIAFALLSALTLLPALLFTIGRLAFWPRRPQYHPDETGDAGETTGFYARVGTFVGRRPRTIAITVLVILLIGGAGVSQLQASGVPQSDLVTQQSDARDGRDALRHHFPGGSGTPAYAIVSQQHLQRAADIIRRQPGVSAVAVFSNGAPGGTAHVGRHGIQSAKPGSATPHPKVSEGDVLLQATLKAPSDSSTAQHTVRQLRSSLGQTAIIGGVTATAIDTNDAGVHDRNLITPIVLIVILMILLRSVVAPVLMMLATVVSLAATLGVFALVFNHLLDLPGADPAVPLYGFIFLVALGVDYNIFLMTRVREETHHHGTRPGIRRALAITGGVITSAGVVLAATFAALAVIPILFLLQLAFIVAFGVLLDTLIVRTLLLPALAYDVGPVIWWPSALDRKTSKKCHTG